MDLISFKDTGSKMLWNIKFIEPRNNPDIVFLTGQDWYIAHSYNGFLEKWMWTCINTSE